MSENSKIEWTDHTFNPWEGCTKVGPGCDHCYAETRNARFGGGQAINWGAGAPRRRTSESNWRKPIKWNAEADAFFAEHGRRQRVFCASLADVFDNEVPIAWLADFLDLCRLTSNLDKLLLTKRIGNVKPRLAEAMEYAHEVMLNPLLANWICNWLDGDFPAVDIWIGATICNQEEADRDIPKLLQVPAAVRFLSMEPLLGPVDLRRHLWKCCGNPIEGHPGDGWMTPPDPPTCCNEPDRSDLDWVIVGGESGPKARPMHPEWARSLRDQCAAAGVPFLFKQWGEWAPWSDYPPGPDLKHNTETIWPDGSLGAGSAAKNGGPGKHMVCVGKKAAGRLLDGRTHDEFPKGAA